MITDNKPKHQKRVFQNRLRLSHSKTVVINYKAFLDCIYDDAVSINFDPNYIVILY